MVNGVGAAGGMSAMAHARFESRGPVEAVAETPPVPGGEHQRGVIRNLLAGHYKGVAEARLSINFADELSAIAVTQAQDATSEALAGAGQTANDLIKAFIDGGQLSESQLTTLTGARDLLLETVDGIASQSLGLDATQNLLDEALKVFGEAVRVAFEPAVAPPPTEPASSGDPLPAGDPIVVSDVLPPTGSLPPADVLPPADPVVVSDVLPPADPVVVSDVAGSPEPL